MNKLKCRERINFNILMNLQSEHVYFVSRDAVLG